MAKESDATQKVEREAEAKDLLVPAEIDPRTTSGERAVRQSLTASGVLDKGVIAVSIFVVAVSMFVVTTLEYGRDQAIYAVVAREILRGGMPYRDVFDFKPPGIFLVYAIARSLFGPAQYGIRILEAISMLGTAAGLVRLARAHFGDRTIGFAAAALAAQVHAQMDFWHTGQPETFGGTLTILGLVTATAALGIGAPESAKPSPRWRRVALWIATGCLFGMAGLMKPPLAGGGAIVAAAGALHVWSKRTRGAPIQKALVSAAEPLFATLVGGVLPIAIVLAWFKSKGALGDLHEVLFVFTPFYTKISWENQSIPGMGYYGFKEWLMEYSSALFAGLVALLLFRPKKGETGFVLTIAALIAVHIVGVVMQAKFFPYHWGATFPLTALLAGLGWMRFARWSAAKGPVVLAGTVILFGVVALLRAPVPNMGSNFVARTLERFDLFVRGPMVQARRDALASVAGVSMAQNRMVAEYVKEHTKPTDTVYVWGFECIIYDLADRPLASRYIYNVPQRAVWSREPMRAALMPELERSKPAIVVVEHGDVFGFVTGENGDSAQNLWDFPALRDLLATDYEMTTRLGDYDIYTRVPEGSRSAWSPTPAGETEDLEPAEGP